MCYMRPCKFLFISCQGHLGAGAWPVQVAGSLQGTNSIHWHTHTQGRLVPNQPDVHIMSVGVRNPF